MSVAIAVAPCSRCGATERTERGQCAVCKLLLPGHTVALVHGARAGVALEAAHDRAKAELIASDPGLGYQENFPHALDETAYALAEVWLRRADLSERGWDNGKGRPRKEAELYEKAAARLSHWLSKMGATPSDAARLGLNLARTQSTSLAAELAAERRERSSMAPDAPNVTPGNSNEQNPPIPPVVTPPAPIPPNVVESPPPDASPQTP